MLATPSNPQSPAGGQLPAATRGWEQRPETSQLELPDSLVARALSRTSSESGSTFEERMAQAEREILRDALGKAEGVLRRAARALRMDPVTLGRRAKKLGLWAPPSQRQTSRS